MSKNRFIQIWLILLTELTARFCMAQVQGEYLSQDKSGILSFVNKEFNYRYSSNVPFNCSDTIAFGNWSEVKGYSLIKLNSNPFHMGGLVESTVSEESTLNQPEKASFSITNPIEKNWLKLNSGNSKARLIYYKLRIELEKNGFEIKTIEVESFDSECKIGMSNGYTVRSFEVIIKPVDLEAWLGRQPRIFRTLKYEVRDRRSNTFKVNIPDLTECYMGSLNLNNEYVILKSKSELLWRGEIFKQVSK